MQRSIQQLVAVFILLTAIAWWITGRVAISNSLRDFFLGEEESSTQTEASPGDQEEALIEKALTDLPPLPHPITVRKSLGYFPDLRKSKTSPPFS